MRSYFASKLRDGINCFCVGIENEKIREKRVEMRIAICDDNITDLRIIEEYCNKYNENYEVNLFISGEDLVEAFQEQSFDLVFLDIEMDGLNGLETGQILRSNPSKPIIIFTTYSGDYAVRGYGIAVRYLIKPISYEEFVSSMTAAMNYIAPKKLCVCDKGMQRFVPVDSIVYLEIFQHSILIYLVTKEKIQIRGTLAELVEQLPTNKFVQPHKSYLINLEHVDRMNKREIIMTNGELIPIGRSKSDSFNELLRKFMRGDSNEYWN